MALIDYKDNNQVYVAHGTAKTRPSGWDSISAIKSYLKTSSVVYVGGNQCEKKLKNKDYYINYFNNNNSINIIRLVNKNSEGINKEEKIKDSEFEVKEESQIIKVTDDQEFFRASDCVQLYLDYLYDNNEEAVKTVLDKNYIENKNISGIDGFDRRY